MTTPTEEAWIAAARLIRIPDTPETRRAFYQGARFALTRLLDNGTEETDMLAFNEELHVFAVATREREGKVEPDWLDEDDADISCPECGAISREGCRFRDRGGAPCEWLYGNPDPMDEIEGYMDG